MCTSVQEILQETAVSLVTEAPVILLAQGGHSTLSAGQETPLEKETMESPEVVAPQAEDSTVFPSPDQIQIHLLSAHEERMRLSVWAVVVLLLVALFRECVPRLARNVAQTAAEDYEGLARFVSPLLAVAGVASVAAEKMMTMQNSSEAAAGSPWLFLSGKYRTVGLVSTVLYLTTYEFWMWSIRRQQSNGGNGLQLVLLGLGDGN